MLSSELIMNIEIQRIDRILLAHEFDPAAYQILQAPLRMAMPVLIKISMILMISQHRTKAHSQTHDHEHSAHQFKT